MNLTNLTFIVTDACNFACSYCTQKKENNVISEKTIKSAADYFYPFFKNDETVHVGFYGGEPLLAFHRVRYAVDLMEKKNAVEKKDIVFSLTTNGVLLDDEILAFFDARRFALMLSFDGLAQELERKEGSMERMVERVNRIREFPGIDFEINSVFTPRTVSLLCSSLRFMIEPGGPGITFNLSGMEPWKTADFKVLEIQLEELARFLRIHYGKTGEIPVKNFLPTGAENGVIPRCGAGREKLAVGTDGEVWGCFLFHDYFRNFPHSPQLKDYRLGSLEEFINGDKKQNSKVWENYNDLRQEYFQTGKTSCFLCPHVERCMICPVYAAYTGGEIGKVSCTQCRLTTIERNARAKFHRMTPG